MKVDLIGFLLLVAAYLLVLFLMVIFSANLYAAYIIGSAVGALCGIAFYEMVLEENNFD